MAMHDQNGPSAVLCRRIAHPSVWPGEAVCISLLSARFPGGRNWPNFECNHQQDGMRMYLGN